ncbi:MAG: hypothetical protein NVSMB46_06320 [Candidatus Saccharimonadales bacterium]
MQERLNFIRNSVTATRIATEINHETTPHIDEQFMRIAEREASKSGAFFSTIAPELLISPTRPDAIRHSKTFLPPNPYSTEEVNNTIGLVDLMLGEQVHEISTVFNDETRRLNLFNNLRSENNQPGKKFIIVSNHLQLPDQGFTMGFLHKSAKEQGTDRLENHLTAVIGRVIGYFQLGNANVIDDILRKAGSVLKTFPAGGSEALCETETEQQTLMLYRGICNHHSKQAFSELLSMQSGRIICMAPSGEQDRVDSTHKIVSMRIFSKGTCEMIIEASKSDATIIPLFVDYGTDKSIVKFLPPRTVSSIKDCHEIGKDIAAIGTHARGLASKDVDSKHRFTQAIRYG